MAEKKFKFSDDEIKLVQRTFKGNDGLLMTVKKMMLQLELTEAEEVAWIKDIKNHKELIRILRKFFLNTLEDKNVEADQMTDSWAIAGREINFRDRRLEDVWPHLVATETVIDYIDKQMEVLGGEKEVNRIIFKEFVKLNPGLKEKSYIGILARNMIWGRVGEAIQKIEMMANVKEETEEERLKRETADSNQ